MFKSAVNRAIFLALTIFCLVVACSSPQATAPSATAPSATTASSTAPSTTGTLAVSVSPWPGYSGDYVAMAKDFYKAEGVDVKESYFQAGSDADTAFLAGRVDVDWTTGAGLIQMASRDPSIKMIMQIDTSNGSDGILGHNITKPQDLKGKKVARENQLFENILLQSYLEKGGLTLKDVTLIDTPAAAAAAAFIANRVDVAVTYEPWLTKAGKQGNGAVIFSTKGTNIVTDVLVTRTKVIQEHKPELLAYLKAVDKAVKLVNSGDQDAIKIVAKKLGVTPEEAKQQISGVKIFDIAENQKVSFNSSNSQNILNNLTFSAQVAEQLKNTSKLVNGKAVVDDSLIKSL